MSRRKSFVIENDNDNSENLQSIRKQHKRQRSITFSQFENLKSLEIISSEDGADVVEALPLLEKLPNVAVHIQHPHRLLIVSAEESLGPGGHQPICWVDVQTFCPSISQHLTFIESFIPVHPRHS